DDQDAHQQKQRPARQPKLRATLLKFPSQAAPAALPTPVPTPDPPLEHPQPAQPHRQAADRLPNLASIPDLFLTSASKRDQRLVEDRLRLRQQIHDSMHFSAQFSKGKSAHPFFTMGSRQAAGVEPGSGSGSGSGNVGMQEATADGGVSDTSVSSVAGSGKPSRVASSSLLAVDAMWPVQPFVHLGWTARNDRTPACTPVPKRVEGIAPPCPDLDAFFAPLALSRTSAAAAAMSTSSPVQTVSMPAAIGVLQSLYDAEQLATPCIQRLLSSLADTDPATACMSADTLEWTHKHQPLTVDGLCGSRNREVGSEILAWLQAWTPAARQPRSGRTSGDDSDVSVSARSKRGRSRGGTLSHTSKHTLHGRLSKSGAADGVLGRKRVKGDGGRGGRSQLPGDLSDFIADDAEDVEDYEGCIDTGDMDVGSDEDVDVDCMGDDDDGARPNGQILGLAERYGYDDDDEEEDFEEEAAIEQAVHDDDDDSDFMDRSSRSSRRRPARQRQRSRSRSRNRDRTVDHKRPSHKAAEAAAGTTATRTVKPIRITGSKPTFWIVQGPSGCGKTALVYAAAAQAGYSVVEVNTSHKRSGKDLLALLGEAALSHRVDGSGKPAAFTASTAASDAEMAGAAGAKVAARDKGKDDAASAGSKADKTAKTGKSIKAAPATGIMALFGSKKRDEPVSKEPVQDTRRDGMVVENTQPAVVAPPLGRSGRRESDSAMSTASDADKAALSVQAAPSKTLILIDDVDVLLEPDRGFWTGIATLAETTKVPIVLTCTEHPLGPQNESVPAPILGTLSKAFKTLVTRGPTPAELGLYIHAVGLSEGAWIDPTALGAVCSTGMSLRQALLTAHAWCMSARLPRTSESADSLVVIKKLGCRAPPKVTAHAAVSDVQGARAAHAAVTEYTRLADTLASVDTASLSDWDAFMGYEPECWLSDPSETEAHQGPSKLLLRPPYWPTDITRRSYSRSIMYGHSAATSVHSAASVLVHDLMSRAGWAWTEGGNGAQHSARVPGIVDQTVWRTRPRALAADLMPWMAAMCRLDIEADAAASAPPHPPPPPLPSEPAVPAPDSPCQPGQDVDNGKDDDDEDFQPVFRRATRYAAARARADAAQPKPKRKGHFVGVLSPAQQRQYAYAYT
ncbi:hypothetical protein BC831DRAFT_474882, partial [Entophlyctis helioformis]